MSRRMGWGGTNGQKSFVKYYAHTGKYGVCTLGILTNINLAKILHPVKISPDTRKPALGAQSNRKPQLACGTSRPFTTSRHTYASPALNLYCLPMLQRVMYSHQTTWWNNHVCRYFISDPGSEFHTCIFSITICFAVQHYSVIYH